MKQILYANKIKLIVLSVALLIVCIFSLVKVDYTLTAPGYNNEVSKFISIESSYNQEGSFHTTSVIVIKRMTSLQYLVGNLEKNVEVVENPEYYDYVDLNDLTIMGYLMKDDSLLNSLVVGIETAGYDIDYTVNQVVYLTYTYLDEDTLELGDIVVSVNGNDIDTELATIECEETATFEIIRDYETMFFDITKHTLNDGTCAFGAFIDPLTEIQSTEIVYELDRGLTSGPSGGLMQSLYVFNLLTPNDMTGGLKIAGTGTIDPFGNVGRIGGIEQKIITSALNGIDVFFVPHLSDEDYDNYVTAVKVLETLNTDMVLVPITTFDDAITYLEGQFGGAWDE